MNVGAFPEPLKFAACVFKETGISKGPSSVATYRSGTMLPTMSVMMITATNPCYTSSRLSASGGYL
jgi:hypothetical protein